METAPDHLAPSFQPWQGPASTGTSQGHCPVGLDDDSSSLGAALPHFPSQDQACSPAGYMPSPSNCGDTFADLILHLIFSILQPREAAVCLGSAQPFSCLPPGMPGNCGLCCTHTGTHRAAGALSRSLSSKKAMFGIPPKRKSEVSGKVTKPSKGEGPQGS